MTNWRPTIVPPWSTADLEGVLNDALRVLDEIGVECTHEGVRERLAARGGVRFVDRRICFSEGRVRAHVEGLRSERPASQDETPFNLGGCWARAKQEIARSAFRLDEAQQRGVDKIYRKAERHIQSRP